MMARHLKRIEHLIYKSHIMVQYEIRFEEMMFQFRHWAQDGDQKRGYDFHLAAERDATYSVAASEAKQCTLSAVTSLSFQLEVA